jgi:hypothetical protein
MSSILAKVFSLSYDSAAVVKESVLKSYYRSVRFIKEADTVNPGKESYETNILLCGNCIDSENRRLYVFYIDVFYGSAWIIEIGIDDRVQKVVYYDKYNTIGFSHLHKIYNARIVNGRIIWTDNINPIYQIDIERAKASHYHGIGYSTYATSEWNEYSYYAETQIVSFGKYFYKCLIANVAEEPASADDIYWERLCGIEDAYYSMNIENFYFAAIPPKMPPVVEYIQDATRNINSLKQTLFQFAYRYIYMDWRKSTFSPASTVALPQAEEEASTGLATELISINNALKIKVNLGGEEVRAIDIVARSSEDPSTWFLVENISKFEDQEKGNMVSKISNSGNVELSIAVMDPTFRNLQAPPAPVATAGTNLTSTSFYANWLTSVGAVGYYLDVSTDPNFATFINGYNNRDVGNVLTWIVRGITSNATYYFRVRAYNTHGLISENSNVITVIIVLEAPIALEATNVFSTGMTANWQAREGATGYYLDVAEDNAFTIFVAGFNNLDVGNVLTYNIAGLIINTAYYYRVRAYNALGTSASSNIIDQRTQDPPSDVVALAATGITLTSFYANWQAATGVTGATNSGYLLDVATDAAFTNMLSGYNNRFVGNVLTFLVRLLNSNTTYYYRIKGVNSHGVMSINYSNIITTKTLIAPTIALAATNTFETGFTANWTAMTGATGYRLDVSTVNTFATFVPGFNNLDVANVTSYNVTGLSVNTAYFYRIRVYDAFQTSVDSNIISQRTQAPPSDPIALPATQMTLTSFYANWEVSAGTPGSYSGYLIDVATDSAFANILSGYNNRDIGNVTTFLVRLLTSNTKYYYRIRAYNAHGILSGYSNTIAVTTLIEAPVALEATNVTGSGMTANWIAVTGATGYILDVATDVAFANKLTGYNNLVIGSVTSYAIIGLTLNTTYFYRVRAYATDSTSDYSSTIDQRTQDAPTVPVATAATSVGPTSFYANWLASTGVGSAYSGYYIDVATDIGFVNKVYDNRDVGNVLTFYARLLNSNTPYFYRVRAYNAHGLVSASSNIITVTTALGIAPPTPVAIAASDISAYSFKANWNASVGATSYLLDVSVSPSFASFVTGYNNLNVGNVASYTVSGLYSNTTYYYRVRAVNSIGTSASSNRITTATAVALAPTITLDNPVWDFGGTGVSNAKAILVTTTNATSWEIIFPSSMNYIFAYTYVVDRVILYYEGPMGTTDTVVFRATGPGGTATTVFSGRWL